MSHHSFFPRIFLYLMWHFKSTSKVVFCHHFQLTFLYKLIRFKISGCINILSMQSLGRKFLSLSTQQWEWINSKHTGQNNIPRSSSECCGANVFHGCLKCVHSTSIRRSICFDYTRASARKLIWRLDCS